MWSTSGATYYWGNMATNKWYECFAKCIPWMSIFKANWQVFSVKRTRCGTAISTDDVTLEVIEANYSRYLERFSKLDFFINPCWVLEHWIKYSVDYVQPHVKFMMQSPSLNRTYCIPHTWLTHTCRCLRCASRMSRMARVNVATALVVSSSCATKIQLCIIRFPYGSGRRNCVDTCACKMTCSLYFI